MKSYYGLTFLTKCEECGHPVELEALLMNVGGKQDA